MSKMLDKDEVMIGGNIMKQNDAAYIIPIGMVIIGLLCLMGGATGWGVGLTSVALVLIIALAVKGNKPVDKKKK